MATLHPTTRAFAPRCGFRRGRADRDRDAGTLGRRFTGRGDAEREGPRGLPALVLPWSWIGWSWIGCCSVVFAGCGAKTGLAEGDPFADAAPMDAAPRDAVVAGDATLDAPLVDAHEPDAFAPDGAVPLACDGRPLPRPGAVQVVDVPPRMQGTGAFVPDPAGILVVGGLTSSGVYAAEMAFIDLSAGTGQSLPVVGDAVRLPLRNSVAAYVPGIDQIIVVGGTVLDGWPTDQVFAISGEGDPGGLRRVRARLLPPYPLGDVQNHVAVYDPRANRVIVHGGRGRRDDPLRYATTMALELGPPARWVEVLPPAASPPRNTYAMGYDPRSHRAIEITAADDGSDLAIHALALEAGAEEWSRLDGIDFVPSTRGELVWDDRVCGFHLLSARRTRCVLEHWILVVSDDGAVPYYRADVELDPPHFLAASVFVPSRDEILVFAGGLCTTSGFPNLAAHGISLRR